jgi:hypothetical protein
MIKFSNFGEFYDVLNSFQIKKYTIFQFLVLVSLLILLKIFNLMNTQKICKVVLSISITCDLEEKIDLKQEFIDISNKLLDTVISLYSEPRYSEYPLILNDLLCTEHSIVETNGE